MVLGVTLEGHDRKLDEGDWQLKVGAGKSPRTFMHTAIDGSNPFCARPTNRKARKKPSWINEINEMALKAIIYAVELLFYSSDSMLY